MYRIISLLLVALFPLWASAEEAARPDGLLSSALANDEELPSYCGVYSLHRAARALDRDIPFREWLKPEYIGSRQGSSLEDLLRAAADHDLHAQPVARMSCTLLRHVYCPVVLHVKNDLATAKDYNHWVVFLGVEDGKARICDGTHPLKLVDFDELASHWDGAGLLVDKAPISLSYLWLAIAAQFVFYFGACIGSIALLLCMQHRIAYKLHWHCWSLGWYRCVRELAMLVVLALVLGAGFRWVNAGGFLSHAPSVAAIRDMHLGGFLLKIKVEDVPSLLGEEGVTIVDARLPQDFIEGHIANAVNIPPSSSPEQCRKAMAKVPTGSRILLYCQSNGCPYSEIVARKLIAQGYSNILYFRDGWIAWEKFQQESAP